MIKIIAFICLFDFSILKTNCLDDLSGGLLSGQLNDFENNIRNNPFYRPKTMENPIDFLSEDIHRNIPFFDFEMKINGHQRHRQLSNLDDDRIDKRKNVNMYRSNIKNKIIAGKLIIRF